VARDLADEDAAVTRSRWAHVSGLALAELVVATAMSLALSGALMALVRLAASAARTQPEVADVGQRVRTGVDAILTRLEAAGAGAAAGGGSVPLGQRVAVIFPHRRAVTGGDAPLSAFADRVTVYAAAESAAVSAVAAPMASASGPLALAPVPGCPVSTPTCQFAPGDVVVVFDATGQHDLATVSSVTATTLSLAAALSQPYSPALGAAVAKVEVRSLVFDPARAQLRVTSAAGSNLPILDDVVRFEVTWLGSPLPPAGPRPPPGAVNCVYDAAGGPALPELSPTWGGLVVLAPAALSDGPVCGSGRAAFDADLLRVRALRVTLRVQAGHASFRAADPRLFMRPGVATDPRSMVPDQEVTFDVVLPNLRGGP
jgi:hypothetical protein